MRNPIPLITALVVCAALIAGCTGGGLFKGFIPTPMPSPTISTSPTSLTFTAANKGPATLTASETNGNTFFTATTTDATIATVTASQQSTNVFSVTATGKVGSCNIQISDGAGNFYNVPVVMQ
ncbi:MAG TPA: hypothetical protein VIX35_13325 [Vicinamibacterales bacterium]